jgi:hypothetical protein
MNSYFMLLIAEEHQREMLREIEKIRQLEQLQSKPTNHPPRKIKRPRPTLRRRHA